MRAAAHPDRRLRPAPVEARLDAPLHLDLAGEPLDTARDFPPRELAAALQRERVGDAHGAVLRAIDRLEHVRPLDVAPLGVEAAGRLQREPPALVGIE